MMIKDTLRKTLSAAAWLCLTVSGIHGAELKTPNIILILADDLGYGPSTRHFRSTKKRTPIGGVARNSG